MHRLATGGTAAEVAPEVSLEEEWSSEVALEVSLEEEWRSGGALHLEDCPSAETDALAEAYRSLGLGAEQNRLHGGQGCSQGKVCCWT